MASKTLPSGPFADCQLCKDTGLQYLPDYPPAYRFCGCTKGLILWAEKPNIVDEANARERELGIGVKK